MLLSLLRKKKKMSGKTNPLVVAEVGEGEERAGLLGAVGEHTRGGQCRHKRPAVRLLAQDCLLLLGLHESILVERFHVDLFRLLNS